MIKDFDKLYEKIKSTPGAVDRILHKPKYGRTSVMEDFNTTAYFAEKVIKTIKEEATPDVVQQERERATEPIDAKNWKAPDEWVYDRNYTYNADEEKYIFITREAGNIVRPKHWVKSLVQAYSNWDGEPSTITDVCRRFGITRGLFNEIKRILGLTHDHEPFTPDEVAEKSSEEMAMEALQMKRFRTKVEFDKQDWRETRKEAKKWRELKQSILDELNAELPSIEVRPIKPTGKKTQPGVIVVETTDWHLGAKAKGLNSVPDFDSKILKDYLDKIIEVVRTEYPDSEVHVHFIGDIMETVTGTNHPDSWKNIEEGFYGAKVIYESIEYLAYLLKGLRASTFRAVTGNHGRLTSDRKRDHDGEAELLVYQMVDKLLVDVDVRWDTYKLHDTVDGIGHILFHGHNRASKHEDIARLITDHRYDVDIDFFMVKQGHTHARNILEDTNLFRHYVVPSLFTGHKYNERNGYGNLAGFRIVYRHPFTDKIKEEDYSL